jgi:hypothetical protein
MQPMPPSNIFALFQPGIDKVVIGNTLTLNQFLSAYTVDEITADQARMYVGVKLQHLDLFALGRVQYAMERTDNSPNQFVIVAYTIEPGKAPDEARTSENSTIYLYLGAELNIAGMIKEYTEVEVA